MTIRTSVLSMIVLATLIACDQVPTDEPDTPGSTATTVDQTPSATPTVPAATVATSEQLRITALEAEIASLKQLLQKFSVAPDGTVVVTGNFRVDGAVGINIAPVPGNALTSVGAKRGVVGQSTDPNSIALEGLSNVVGGKGVSGQGWAKGVEGQGQVGVGGKGLGSGIALHAEGGAYSFYGYGPLYNFGSISNQGFHGEETTAQ